MEKKIAVIGLGYVGLPLAVEFAKKYPTIGFDINTSRVNQLMSGHDHTLEVEDEDLQKDIVPDLLTAESNGKGLFCTTAVGDIESANLNSQIQYHLPLWYKIVLYRLTQRSKGLVLCLFEGLHLRLPAYDHGLT